MISMNENGVHIVQIETDVLYDDVQMLNLYGEIDRLLDTQPVRGLVLDFAQVKSTGSVGLSMLVRLKTKCDKRDCTLGLCGMSPTVLEVLQITNLDQLFRICDNSEQFVQETGLGG